MTDDQLAGLISGTEEATEGGLRAVEKVEGILESPRREASKFKEGESKFGKPKDQLVVKLSDAVILRMKAGESEPELKDDTFTVWYGYAEPGKLQPHKNTFVVKGFMKSAEDLWKARGFKDAQGNATKGWKDLIGQRVVMEKCAIELFQRAPAKGEESKVAADGKVHFLQTQFVFVEGSPEDSTPIEEHIRGLIVGLNPQAALRKVLMDSRAKREVKWKNAINDGTITSELNLTVVDGKYSFPEEA